mgnify:CR=1 FL=1
MRRWRPNPVKNALDLDEAVLDFVELLQEEQLAFRGTPAEEADFVLQTEELFRLQLWEDVALLKDEVLLEELEELRPFIPVR